VDAPFNPLAIVAHYKFLKKPASLNPTPNGGLKFSLWPGKQLHSPANFSGSYPNDVNHDDGNLSNSYLPGVLFNNTSAKRLNLAGANVEGANFSNTNLFKAFVKNIGLTQEAR
jgi:hypothetical protein